MRILHQRVASELFQRNSHGNKFSPTFCWATTFQNSRLSVTQSQMLMAWDVLLDLQVGCANNLKSVLIFTRRFWDASTKTERRGMVELAGSIWILLLARNLFQELTWRSFSEALCRTFGRRYKGCITSVNWVDNFCKLPDLSHHIGWTTMIWKACLKDTGSVQRHYNYIMDRASLPV